MKICTWKKVEKCLQGAGCRVVLDLPGIMPITTAASLKRFSGRILMSLKKKQKEVEKVFDI